MLQPITWLLVAVALFAGCGKKADVTKKDAGAAPGPAPLALPPLGVDRVQRFNFIYGDGAAAYKSATDKAKAKDWAGARAMCEAALAKDPSHLDAQRLLAVALAQGGDPAAAVDHLVTALAGDYYKYAPTLGDADLAPFNASPHGKAVEALAQQIAAEYARRIQSSLWLVGRRSSFKWPEKPGAQSDTPRGELYAYDRDSKRFLRLTHTDHQVAGFVRGASQVAILGFDKVDRPKDPPDAPPLVAAAWVEAIDSATWQPIGKPAKLGAAREIIVGYGTGDQLLVATANATARWTVGDLAIQSVDLTTGKLTKTGAPAVTFAPRIEFTLDEGRAVHVDKSTLAGDSVKTANGPAIKIPESGQASPDTIATSPDEAHIAFATAVDPCAKDAAPSLYVADAKTGVLKHLLTARSRFQTRWIDAQTLAYEDGDGAIRLWDAATGRESQRLDDKAGLSLDVLSLANAPICKQAPQPEPVGSGSDEPLPPEEPK